MLELSYLPAALACAKEPRPHLLALDLCFVSERGILLSRRLAIVLANAKPGLMLSGSSPHIEHESRIRQHVLSGEEYILIRQKCVETHI